MHGRGAQDNPNFDIWAFDGLTQSAWEHVTFVVNGKDQTITTFLMVVFSWKQKP